MNKSSSAALRAVALAVIAVSMLSTDAFAAKKRPAPKPATPAAAAAPAAAPASAHGPDLVVLADQTTLTVNPKGCEPNEDLFSGTVAVKNQGDGRADRLIVEPIVSIYIPDMLDLKDDKLTPNSLAPLDVFTTDVHVGKGKAKEGRGLTGKHKVYILVDPQNKIAETNEQNNLLVRELTFNCK